MKKKRIILYLTEEDYKQFKIQSVILGKSVSERIDNFIKEQIKDMKKEK